MPSVEHFDQWILDRSVETPTRGASARIRFGALRLIRRLRLAFSDSVVNYSLGKTPLRVPFSHELPFYRRMLPEYSDNLRRITVHVQGKYSNLCVIDIGANVGDSIALIRQSSNAPVLAIEGDGLFFSLLAENKAELHDVELFHGFVGAQGDEASYLERKRGNARLARANSHDPILLHSLSEILKSHPRFAKAKLLKIDAEGFDARILSTETNWLRIARPIVFFEYCPAMAGALGFATFSVFEKLQTAGYCAVFVYRNSGTWQAYVRIDDSDSLRRLDAELRQNGGFCDVVAFHEEDIDLANGAYAEEQTAANKLDSNARLPATSRQV